MDSLGDTVEKLKADLIETNLKIEKLLFKVDMIRKNHNFDIQGLKDDIGGLWKLWENTRNILNSYGDKIMDEEAQTKITIEYTLPRDSYEYKIFEERHNFYDALHEIEEVCRKSMKYGEPESAEDFAEKIREIMYEYRVSELF